MFTQTNEVVAWQHVKQTRQDLLDYFNSLAEEDWNRASSCEGWQVRDVVAHLILEYQYSARKDWRDFASSGLNINRFMKHTAMKLGRRPTAELLGRFKAMSDLQQKPASISVINVLAGLLIHEQDIRLPLKQPRLMPAGSLRLIFTHWEPTKFNLGEKLTGVTSRVKGIQFVMQDLNITKGTGPEVSGLAQDIIMTVAGRKTSLTKLKGEGAELLKLRLK